MLESAVLLSENMNTSDHNACSIVVPQVVAMDAVRMFRFLMQMKKECDSVFLRSGLFLVDSFSTRRTANLQVLDSLEDLPLVVAMDALGA